ncbi:hypothetical protein [Frankia sp. Cj3]|uniref:hypothetical protein n=1 Tax=Frankia sp. Cj3 TaxID=2880976 RepID=UPI001EF4EDF7|nr:hypothetical protein [Frankia sp. Cj3]
MSTDSMSTDGWPGADQYPYRILIRIRYAYQLDSWLAGIAQRAVARLLPTERAAGFAAAVTAGTARAVLAQTRDARTASAPTIGTAEVAAALDEFDELCPRPPGYWPPHRPWPGLLGPEVDPWVTGPVPDPWGPRPEPWRAGGAAEATAAILAAVALIQRAGSDALQAEIEPVLREAVENLAG